MERRVLYEAGLSFEIGFLLVLVVPLMFLFFCRQEIKNRKRAKKWGKKVDPAGKIVMIAGAVILLMNTSMIIPHHMKMYKKTVEAYRHGEYLTVEGYVESFDPQQIHVNGDTESFVINGVKFKYSAATVQFGYHNAWPHNKIIAGDGQHLRIGYIYYDNFYGNIIVYIEELP